MIKVNKNNPVIINRRTNLLLKQRSNLFSNFTAFIIIKPNIFTWKCLFVYQLITSRACIFKDENSWGSKQELTLTISDGHGSRIKFLFLSTGLIVSVIKTCSFRHDNLYEIDAALKQVLRWMTSVTLLISFDLFDFYKNRYKMLYNSCFGVRFSLSFLNDPLKCLKLCYSVLLVVISWV